MSLHSGGDATAAPTNRELQTLVNERAPILQQLSEGVIIAAADGRLLFVNEAAELLHGVKKLDVGPGEYARTYSLFTMDGAPYPFEQLPLARAVAAGETVADARWRIRRPDGSEVVAIGSARPLVTEGRQIGAILNVRDDSARFEAETKLRESEERLRLIVDAAGSAFYSVDRDGNTNLVSRGFLDLVGMKNESEALGKKLHGLIHHSHPDGSEYAVEDCPIYQCASAAKPAHVVDELFYRFDGSAVPVEYWVSPIMRGDEHVGAICTILDLTERNEAEEAFRLKAAEFEALAENVTQLAWMAAPDGSIFWYNKRWYDYTGTSPETQAGWGWESVHDPQVLPMVLEQWTRSLFVGEPFEMTFPLRASTGEFRPFLTRAVPIRDDAGDIVRWFGTNTDISAQLAAEKSLRERGQQLTTLNRVGAALARELDLETVVQMVTDAGVELTGAQFGAFFYNVVSEAGESYMLYTLSGADRSQFEHFGLPRNTAVFEHTFSGRGVVRSDDITKDERYGKNAPHKGMPKGHLPVRSYLAMPVQSQSGEIIGGLFFGHPDTGRFTLGHEELMTGIAAQAAISMDNARLYRAAQSEIQQRLTAETALTALNDTLELQIEKEVERRTEAEEALRQSQKMETLGQLTGGIAHDFNNLLQIIAGNLDIIRRALPEDSPRLVRSVDHATRGAERAAVLTQRLLAFSRRQPLAPKVLDPNKLVSGMSEMLHRALGETIQVETVLGSGLWRVEADPNQLESALLNLAVNSRDAMPGGGKLTVETANTHIDRDYAARNSGVSPGQYVVMCVSDTGTGMDVATADRAFDPFFTTKEVGKGTGLGLSMVYGFVKQSGGHLKIYSEPGDGTTVKIYLPRHHGPEEMVTDTASNDLAPEGVEGETILVCEDDDDVRAYSVEVLRELGYRVIEAADGAEALRMLESDDGSIDLLFTDIVLPGGMTGAVVAERARKSRPGLKVLFTTGYARNAIVHHGRLDAGVELLSKPFAYAELAARIRDLLDAP